MNLEKVEVVPGGTLRVKVLREQPRSNHEKRMAHVKLVGSSYGGKRE